MTGAEGSDPEADRGVAGGTASPVVRVERDGIVALVTLADPANRNSLSAPLGAALLAVLDELEADEEVGALVLAADPPAFCAGGHLPDLLPQNRRPLAETYEPFLRLRSSPLPSVAAVGGAAVGAGVNLVLACDVALATPGARFDVRWLAVGIHPGGGSCWSLQRAIGTRRAAALTLLAEGIGGEEAAEVGLVHRCVGPADLVPSAVAAAQRMAGVPRELMRRTRQTLRLSEELSAFDQAVALEAEQQAWSMDQPDLARAVEAALSRRRRRP